MKKTVLLLLLIGTATLTASSWYQQQEAEMEIDKSKKVIPATDITFFEGKLMIYKKEELEEVKNDVAMLF